MLKYDRNDVKAWAKSRIPILWEKRLGIVLAVVGALLVIFFSDFVKMVTAMAAFVALGAASMMYNRWIKVSLGIELIMLGIVAMSAAHGSVAGMVTGMIALFLAEVLTDRFTYSTFVSFIGIFAVAIAVPMLGSMSITWKGIWMTVLYDAVIGPGYVLMGSSPWRTLLFVVTHIMFNVWVFTFIAPGVFRIVA